MKLIAALLTFISSLSFAGSCCVGSGPRSFVQLKHLQTYDLGVATSFKDTYARFNLYGNRVKAEKQQSATMTFGASMRVAPRSEIFGLMPLVTKAKTYGGDTKTRSDLGDVAVGGRVLLYDPFYGEDWFPETKIVLSVKAPTGRREGISLLGQPEPGTGNGIWEGSAGLQFVKDLGEVLVTVSPAYTRRVSQTVLVNNGEVTTREGDRLELNETLTLPISERLSLSIGSNQVWDLDGEVSGARVADSGGRTVSGFMGASYFVTRTWTVGASFESVLPIEKLSMNQEAYRTISFTSTYAIY